MGLKKTCSPRTQGASLANQEVALQSTRSASTTSAFVSTARPLFATRKTDHESLDRIRTGSCHSYPFSAVVFQRSRAHWSLHADRKSTRLNSSHVSISYAVFCLK